MKMTREELSRRVAGYELDYKDGLISKAEAEHYIQWAQVEYALDNSNADNDYEGIPRWCCVSQKEFDTDDFIQCEDCHYLCLEENRSPLPGSTLCANCGYNDYQQWWENSLTELPELDPPPASGQRHWSCTIKDDIKLEMVWIDPATDLDPDDMPLAKPPEEMATRGFWLGKYPITHEQYTAITGKVYDDVKWGEDHPIRGIWRGESHKICRMLGEYLGFKDPVFRMPRVPEWEFAAYAGKSWDLHPDITGDDYDLLKKYAITYEPVPTVMTSPVGARLPDALGLHDMIGNVWEWCWKEDPEAILKHHHQHVARGGSTQSGGFYCFHLLDTMKSWSVSSEIGLRVVMVARGPEGVCP